MIKKLTSILLTGLILTSATASASTTLAPTADKKISKPIKVEANMDAYGEVSLKWDSKEGTTYIVTKTDKEGNITTLAKTKLSEISDICRHKGVYTYSVLPVVGSMPVSVASLHKLKVNGSNLDLKLSGRNVTITGKSTKDADGYIIIKNDKKKNIQKKKSFKLTDESDTIVKYQIRAFKTKENKRLYTDSITRYIYVSDFDAEKALEYARKYALEYNPEYHDYNPQGGDCANFVSQCLSYGGMKETEEWNYTNDKGTSAWINVRSMFEYFSQKYEVIEYPTYDDIQKGDIIMKRDLSHVVICSGKNEQGVPLICAHNDKHLDDPLYGDISGWIVVKPTSGAINKNIQPLKDKTQKTTDSLFSML